MMSNFTSGITNTNKTDTQCADNALDRIWTLINQQQASPALSACQQFNQNYPDNADGWYASSFLAFQLKNFKQALSDIEKAIKLQPDEPQWQLHKAHSLLVSGATEPAQIIIEGLATGKYQDVDFCAELALVLNQLSNFEQAAVYYQQAINLLPKRSNEANNRKAQLCFNLASIQRYLGQLDDAEESLNLAIALNPSDNEAYLLRASLKKQTNKFNHIIELEQVLSRGIKHPIGKAQLCYALAKEHEDLAEYQQSFTFLKQGADSRRSNMRYDVKHDVETINQIMKTFDSAFFSQKLNNHQYCHNDEAIFVLGLPRTGSTLVERIISHHDAVFSAGELNNFSLQMMEEIKSYVHEKALQPPRSKVELVALTAQLDFAKMGQAYIDSTRPDTEHLAHFVDKLPLNSLYVGLIHLALPQAKIIHVKRHPLDTCYAIYKQLFTHGYPFSYDLTELGQYYIAHHQLMQHWEKVLPEVIYHIAYEDVVDDIDTQAKALISHCGLQWQDQCSDFKNNKAPSTTASATQVRQDVYHSSNGKWRHYEQQLAALKAQLEQAGICCD